jgi:hypothetical protein
MMEGREERSEAEPGKGREWAGTIEMLIKIDE